MNHQVGIVLVQHCSLLTQFVLKTPCGHHPNSQRLLFGLASGNDPVAPHNTAQCAGDMRQEAAGEDGTWLVTG